MLTFLSGKKKFLALALAVIINGVNDVFHLGLSANTLEVTNYISGGYIAIEGLLDFIRAINTSIGKSKGGTTSGTTDDLNVPIESAK